MKKRTEKNPQKNIHHKVYEDMENLVHAQYNCILIQEKLIATQRRMIALLKKINDSV